MVEWWLQWFRLGGHWRGRKLGAEVVVVVVVVVPRVDHGRQPAVVERG